MKSMAEIFRSHCVFDAEGRHTNGTDRQSNHAYGDAYDAIFPNRDAVKMLLEIGTADGSGLMAWKEAFTDAHVVGLDIHVCDKALANGIEFHLGDQRSKADCERAAGGRQFDAIIEDAFHSTENTLLTLFWLWPFVKPGGIYVVEEWADVHSCKANIMSLWRPATFWPAAYESKSPLVEIVNTIGPHGGGIEPLVVLRKPL
jgi:hypothetical protein